MLEMSFLPVSLAQDMSRSSYDYNLSQRVSFNSLPILVKILSTLWTPPRCKKIVKDGGQEDVVHDVLWVTCRKTYHSVIPGFFVEVGVFFRNWVHQDMSGTGNFGIPKCRVSRCFSRMPKRDGTALSKHDASSQDASGKMKKRKQHNWKIMKARW